MRRRSRCVELAVFNPRRSGGGKEEETEEIHRIKAGEFVYSVLLGSVWMYL